jgi:DNA invertase Pin-like site-specific DNA recombinase
MSTEHQRYSTANQSDAIRQYAQRRGFEIVRTYADEGRSGLTFRRRGGLSRLIRDVQSGQAEFEVILVYDVSRWGRFQDTDESAHYEYLCKQAGISIEYCAEQFENDGSIASMIIKAVKRAMAGEYSRELSTKVFAGQSRVAKLGFRTCGPAGYGFRRQLVDKHGQPKALLARGERKSLQTDRVVLVPGPEAEVKTIERIYRDFLELGLAEGEIATNLNQEEVRNSFGRPWTWLTIREVLTNEKYCGHNVYNRRSVKLRGKVVYNDPGMWVRADNAFQALIAPEVFRAAQALIRARYHRYTDAEMLDHLRALQQRYGYLTKQLVDNARGVPSTSCYRRRFGSLVRAYELIGYLANRDCAFIEASRHLRQLHRDTLKMVVDRIGQSGATVVVDPATGLVLVNGEFTVSLVVARALEVSPKRVRWEVRPEAAPRSDILVVVRMEAGNQVPRDYLLLPRAHITSRKLYLTEGNGAWLDAYRYESFDPLYRLAERVDLGEVA